jgi:hypothetical protein
MIVAALFALELLAAQCTGAACPNPCTACTYQPVSGTNPTLASWRSQFAGVAERTLTAGLPTVRTIETGPGRGRTAAPFPCRLMPAIGMAESGIAQFCAGSGLSIISFDCGFGVMQVTSGAANYPGIEARADINIAAGADILASKWNGNESFGGQFGDSDPAILEGWYFATWAYNGFVYSNNPNNPDRPADRPPFNSPATLSRRSYPYQEIVWGYLGYPQSKEGEQFFTPLDVRYPALCSGDVATCCPGGLCSGVPNQSGLFSVTVPLPPGSHTDPCTEECPPQGCPAAEDRLLILDDADSTFTITGEEALVTAHDAGGFRDGFRTMPPSEGAATVVARFVGVAPASGTFNLGGFVPLSPAENEAVPVRVFARGAPLSVLLDHSVAGGFFAPLGQVKLRAGDEVVVEVSNDSTAAGRLGIDAFRFAWVGDGAVVVGDACAASVDCAGDNVCVAGFCAAGCEVAGCSAGLRCVEASGLCVSEGEGEGEGEGAGEGEGEGEGQGGGEGEGEGEGDAGRRPPPPSSVIPGCAAGGGSGTGPALPGAVAGLLLGCVLLGNRRHGRFRSTLQ